jgi:outer membrane lipoprotein LolB
VRVVSIAMTLVAAALVAGCATRPLRPTTVLDVAQGQALLTSLDRYSFEGRVAASAGTQGFNASLDWQQSGAGTNLRLSGPLGAGTLRIRYADSVLHIESSRGQILDGTEADAALQAQLGFAPPLGALRYWLLALPSPGTPAAEERDAAGRLKSLEQDGWRVEYEEYQPQASSAGSVQMPRRLRATRESLRLRVVVDSWHLLP